MKIELISVHEQVRTAVLSLGKIRQKSILFDRTQVVENIQDETWNQIFVEIQSNLRRVLSLRYRIS